MKVASVIILLIFLIAAGCDSDNRNSESTCTTPEDLVTSSCLAEDVSILCEPLLCGSEIDGFAVDFLVPSGFDCLALDCETLDCGEDGLFLNLGLSENDNLIGVAIFDELELDFVCP